MRWTSTAAIAACAMLTAAFVLPAEAQQNRQRGVQSVPSNSTVYTTRDEDGRVRTRIVVQKRSYLDPGTESMYGAGHSTDYVQLPGQRPTDVFGPSQHFGARNPLNNWFDYGFNCCR
jgi:hypothetical protein